VAAVSALTASTNVYAPIITTPISNAATAIATTGFYGAIVGSNVAAVSALTASTNVYAPIITTPISNAATAIATTGFYGAIVGANVASVSALTASTNVYAPIITTPISNAATAIATTGFYGAIVGANVASVTVLTASTNVNAPTMNVQSLNVSTQANVTYLNVSSSAFMSSANISSANISTANITNGNIASLNVTGDSNIANLRVASNLYTNNIIMASNLSTNTGYGNVYLTGNLVVLGNIFSIGGSVGSGSGTSQGVLYSLASNYPLGSAFATGSAGPGIQGFHVNLTSFNAEATQSVSAFSAGTGMLKFMTGGLYQITCVVVGDQPLLKVGIGKQSSATFPTGTGSAIAGYEYVYNLPTGSSPSTTITIPLTITDTSVYYYLDVFFATGATTLYPTRSTTAAGTNYGTYIQVAPFGNYLTSATGVASGLLMNCSASTTLSAPVTSNTFRLAMTSANGWTVNGVSTSLAVTAGGNFQVNQAGIYEVSMCLNATGATPMMIGLGSLATDTAPSTQGPYIYQYSPMYTQDPTTVLSLPVNFTDTSKYYYIDVIFPLTQATVVLSNVSTYVMIKPIGSYVSPSTNPWAQQGTTVTYNAGQVGIGAGPVGLTETFTVNGNTAFIGNVTVTSDASGSTYVNAKRVPAGSLDVTRYVTGSVPLTTTTNLIRNYLSNAATITANTSTGTITQALYVPATTGSFVNLGSNNSVNYSNLALSNLFVEAWVNISTTGVTRILAARTNGTTYDFALQITSGNIVTFDVYNTSGTQSRASNATTLSAGTWYHVAGSYNRTGLTAGTVLCFVNGGVGGTTGTVSAAGPRVTPTANIYIAGDNNASVQSLAGNVADVRVMTNCIVPVATFSPQAAPFTTAPVYRTGMDTGYTSNLTLALNTQYFPGASTSPYGPCLTLPGTVGSYYAQLPSAAHSDWKTTGFTLEAWVNFASLANSNVFNTGASYPLMITTTSPPPNLGSAMYGFGPTTTGQIAFVWWASGGTNNAFVTSNTITTGTWNHLMVQGNGSNVYMAINGNFTTLTAQGFAPTSGAGTIAPTLAPSTTAGPQPGSAMTVGQYYTYQGPNFSVAKARLIYGANVYSSGSFTPNPNFATSATAPFWSLDTQYPLPTYPSIQDVTPIPSQLTSFGAVPTPIGGVTSNTLSPYSTTYPQLDSIRFDGTGYIDYGNAASSVLTSNIWASPWTIEGWVYPTGSNAGFPTIFARSNASTTDLYWGIDSTGVLKFNYGSSASKSGYYAYTPPYNTWTHVALTYDGARSNLYASGTFQGSASIIASGQTFVPSFSTQIGATTNGTYGYWIGNLADVRVSNVARYSGTTYVVPSAPFTTDSSTLLLLKSLGQQTGTTLQVQGRGLNAVSLGATRSVKSYPPAPMSSYLLDTTSNASVTYGQGKYVASASSEYQTNAVWYTFDKNTASALWSSPGVYAGAPYIGAVTTVDILGNSYAGEWIQLQIPVSIILSSYQMRGSYYATTQSPEVWRVLGSNDGINWTLVDSRTGIADGTALGTYTVSSTQAYNYYRMVINRLQGAGSFAHVTEWTLNGTEESLCITSDAKVGVGIANPQRALEVAGDLIVGGTISGGAGMGGFRNRIINGDMRIAQRGTSATTGGYLLDRWAVELISGTVTQTRTQLVLDASDTPYQLGFKYAANVAVTSSSTGAPFVQKIENINITDLNWGTSYGSPVTASLWYKTNAAPGSIIPISIRIIYWIGGSAFKVYPYNTVAIGQNTWQYVSFTVPPPPNQGATLGMNNNGGQDVLEIFIGSASGYATTAVAGTWTDTSAMGSTAQTNIYKTPGTYMAVTGVQLEKGTVATPWEQRPYATELALCQRYYTQLNAGSTYARFGTVYSVSTTSSNVYIPLPVTMRARPTLTMTIANFRVDEGSSQQTVTSVTPASGSAVTDWQLNAAGLTVGHGAVAAANLPGFLEANGTTSAFLGFSAEL
jgi:hypothetical protein